MVGHEKIDSGGLNEALLGNSAPPQCDRPMLVLREFESRLPGKA